MITENWVRIPVKIQDIITIGVGSAKIDRDGNIEVTLPSGETFGRATQEAFRSGAIEALMIVPIPSSPKFGDIEEFVSGG